MELSHLAISICVLYSLALVGDAINNHAASLSDEDYWHTVWPNSPIPSGLHELSNADPTDVEIKDIPMVIEDTQYLEAFLFFQHDLYPGKTMNVFTNESASQTGIFAWIVKDVEKFKTEGYTFKEICKRNGGAYKGQGKYCAKTLGTLIGFAISKLGKNIHMLSSSFVDKQGQYTVEGIQNLGEKAVICHRLNFHRIVFYCHENHGTTTFNVSLVAGNGTKTHALAICHDTTGMNHDMLSEILGVDPGTKPVCHFLGNKSVLWLPN
ncbi:hypothetical protein RIF29_13911 [Crotalaria pallida]|uniref:BURP domain-containing protein n=1 Tax=Crotalaria pallida TaxID=3830 RepID=A0AAN9FCU3_CROPI